MKAVIDKKSLVEGVRTAGHAISGRTALPILSHILAKAEDGAIWFSGTDHQIGITIKIEADVKDSGSLTLPASIATEVITSLPEGSINLEGNDSFQVNISAPPSEFQILGLPPSEFPALPEVPNDVWFDIPAKELRAALKRTGFAVSTDELRTILLGVYFIYSGDELRLVATDTHRLAMDVRMIATGEGEASAVIPSRAVSELQRLLTDEGTVRIHLSDRQVQFTVQNIILTANLIEGQFPNYERVIPADFDKKIVLPTSMFTPAVRRTAIVARGDMNRIVMKTEGEKVTITSRAGAVGRAHEEVEVVREGDDIEIAFNSVFLLDVLDVIDTEGVQIEMSGGLAPVVVRPVDQEDYLCVVMPMQLSEGLSDV